VPLADFFRGLRLIVAGDFRNASTNLYCADMTEVPFSLELLGEADLERQQQRLELEPHSLPEPEPMDDLASFLDGEAPVDDLVPVPVVDPKPHSSYLDHL
jgi:hypothetical protein